MRISSGILIILTLLHFCPSFKSKKVFRIRSVKCSTSGQTVIAHYCRLRTFKRTSFYSLGLNLSRTVENVMINVLYERKSQFDKFENIIKLDNIEFCNILMNTTLIRYMPVIGSTIYHLIQFGNVLDFCRATSKYIVMSNVTWDTYESLQLLPKGEYKFNYQWFDRKDEKLFFCQLYGNIF